MDLKFEDGRRSPCFAEGECSKPLNACFLFLCLDRELGPRSRELKLSVLGSSSSGEGNYFLRPAMELRIAVTCGWPRLLGPVAALK